MSEDIILPDARTHGTPRGRHHGDGNGARPKAHRGWTGAAPARTIIVAMAVALAITLSLALAAVLSACASAPVKFLTLVPPAGDASGGMRPASGLKMTVTVASQDDQTELVVRQPDGSMRLLESVRWIAPLGDEIRTALTLALAPHWPAVTSAPSHIGVQVQRFDSATGNYALIEAAWTVTLNTEPVRSVSCRSAIRQSVGAGYPALAAGHRAALQELAVQMLRATQTLATTSVAPGVGAAQTVSATPCPVPAP